MSDEIHAMLLGATAMGSLVVAVKFLKFWRLSRDRFFIWFALAFVVFAFGFVIRVLFEDPREQALFAYLPRLICFGLIAFAIVDKNRSG